jgi:endonuclease VIII
VPEGDTVWLTAKRLDQALAGRTVTIFDLRVPQLATADLRGELVSEVVPRGKHILIRFGNGSTLHSHLQMDGSWYLVAAGRQPTRYPNHMIRALIGNSEWLAACYRVHDLRLLRTADEAVLVGHLGPDLLGADWDPDDAVRRLLDQSDREIGDALLDQRNLAGIGNMYKSETLFIERVDPWTPVARVADLTGVVTTAQRLLRANRDHPEQSTTGRIQRGEQHWVYGRADEPCRRCRTPIRRAQQGAVDQQRSTYWCPSCQARS